MLRDILIFRQLAGSAPQRVSPYSFASLTFVSFAIVENTLIIVL